MPVPTADGTPAEEIQTFSDEKSIGMFTACENQATAWDVLKFATSEEQDGALLEATGQMPMRTDVARTLTPTTSTPTPTTCPSPSRPTAPSRCPTWPTRSRSGRRFRDAWSESVIFGDSDPQEALTAAADKINGLVAEN